jgi:hypothetical protein
MYLDIDEPVPTGAGLSRTRFALAPAALLPAHRR